MDVTESRMSFINKSQIAGKHKIWRREAKKMRRKRLRQAGAKARDKLLEKEEEKMLNNPAYRYWLNQQNEIEEFQRNQEERIRQENNELWIRREQFAQTQFQEDLKRREALNKIKEEEREKIQKEFEDLQRQAEQRRKEKLRLAEEAKKKREELLEKIEDYLNGQCEMPEELNETSETNPGKPQCPFFIKTAACRFGAKCNNNHIKPGISKLILLPNFFTHISLEQHKTNEYGTDIGLEFSDNDMNVVYDEFFNDVVTELKTFGQLKSFATCKNFEAHLRGNVYIEFFYERDALRAFRKLQGRFYAGKQINAEFCKIISWRSALCGLSLMRRCPKGQNCNFLHIFKNPERKYNPRNEVDADKRIINASKTVKLLKQDGNRSSWDNIDEESSSRKRDWRWSESPESKRSSDKKSNTGSTSRHFKDDDEQRARRSSRRDCEFRSRSKSSDLNVHMRNYSTSNTEKSTQDKRSSRRELQRSRSRSRSRRISNYRENGNESKRRSRSSSRSKSQNSARSRLRESRKKSKHKNRSRSRGSRSKDVDSKESSPSHNTTTRQRSKSFSRSPEKKKKRKRKNKSTKGKE